MIHERLAELGRQALVADSASAEANTLSGQGGVPLGRPGETWPTLNGEPLFPVLTVHTHELPVVPDFLAGGAYWVFFIERDAFEQTVSDGSLVVRQYPEVSELVPLPQPVDSSAARLGFSFRAITDYPSSTALAEILGEELGGASIEELDEEFPCHDGIKLGGWPLLIQHTAFLATDQPDFQIQLDGTELYDYADSGIGYIYGGLQYVIWESM